MTQVATIVFAGSATVIIYVLFGYPFLLSVLARRENQSIRRSWSPKTVSIVIPVHNGEQWIEAKVRSLGQLEYPRDLVQIIVIDDGSTDATARLIKRADDPRIELLSLKRSGKAAALNAGIAKARGEVLLFTDVRQSLHSSSLRSLVECLGDRSIGVVSGELVIMDPGSDEEANIGLYWEYEKWIRKRLSRVDSVLGATGAIYAMRRDLAVALPSHIILDDVFLPMAAFFKGFRLVFDEQAKAFDFPTALRSEFKRKVRTLAGVYQIAGTFPRLLVPTQRMAIHFWSYKIGRLMLPFALIAIAISSLWLPGRWKLLAVIGQAGFYLLAAADGWCPANPWLKRVTSLARTFVVLMGAALCAPFYLATHGRHGPGWSTTEIRRQEIEMKR